MSVTTPLTSHSLLWAFCMRTCSFNSNVSFSCPVFYFFFILRSQSLSTLFERFCLKPLPSTSWTHVWPLLSCDSIPSRPLVANSLSVVLFKQPLPNACVTFNQTLALAIICKTTNNLDSHFQTFIFKMLPVGRTTVNFELVWSTM